MGLQLAALLALAASGQSAHAGSENPFGEEFEGVEGMRPSLEGEPLVVPADEYPEMWGEPPAMQTMDYVPLPGGYGHGSSSLADWIQQNMIQERKSGHGVSYPPVFGEPPRIQTRDYSKLPFGYGHGSGSIARWLTSKAKDIYGETPQEYDEWYKDDIED
eukprot:CAMPEP_0115852928 /NCGR_PEP_ID=MMETSP0287-20121206/13244_1 /TAXON_ID=412157 /ORGANISM="Chrysochromulina rotalis, Strain UIO044" /LENGTH=159 /DNA_ID=CAMNT_0003306995 /DNA_START=17 /DNA_END=496 /DNA_ORIENTATION=-